MSALFLLLIACESPAPPPPAAEPPTPASSSATPAAQAQDEARALAQAHEAASLLGSTLKSRMGQAMGQGGPDAAVAVCADEAQGLAAQVRGSTGARVGRASLKLRNPANAGPDWVQAWLREQGERPAEGAPARSEIADTEAGRVARVIRPIAVEPLCLSCHGDPAAIPEGVQAVLAQRYPQDQATGYLAGALRGALWAEVAVSSAAAAPAGTPATPATP